MSASAGRLSVWAHGRELIRSLSAMQISFRFNNYISIARCWSVARSLSLSLLSVQNIDMGLNGRTERNRVSEKQKPTTRTTTTANDVESERVSERVNE